MRPVAVIGTGKTAFGAFPDATSVHSPWRPGKMPGQRGSPPAQIESFYLGNFAGPSFVGQNHLAPYVSTGMGITAFPPPGSRRPARRADRRSFTPWSAVGGGHLRRRDGASGVEKMTSQPTPRSHARFWRGGRLLGRRCGGEHLPVAVRDDRAAPHARVRHDARALAAVAVKNHANGALNPLRAHAKGHHPGAGAQRQAGSPNR